MEWTGLMTLYELLKTNSDGLMFCSALTLLEDDAVQTTTSVKIKISVYSGFVKFASVDAD